MASTLSEALKETPIYVHEKEKAQESEAEEADSHAVEHGSHVRHSCKANFLRLGPLSGLFAIGLIVCCIFANLAILLTSKNASTSSWEYQPSTYLAITTAVANLALRYACIQGLVIAWWSRASQGSTIRKLHQDWKSGSSFFGAVSHGRHMGFLGLACVLVTLGAIDGPLLQRVIKVESVLWRDHPVTLNTSLVPQIPTDLTGFWTSIEMTNRGNREFTGFNRNIPSSPGNTSNNIVSIRGANFTENIRQAYFMDHPLRGAVQGCPSVCKAKLRAPALAITSCSTRLIPVNYNFPSRTEPFNRNGIPILNHTSFVSMLDLIVSGEQEVVNIVAGYAKTSGCIGTLNLTACTLSSATGEYSVTIHGEDITLDPTEPTIVAFARNAPVNNTHIPLAGKTVLHPSTLAGIVELGFEKYNSQAVYGGDKTFMFNGFPSQQYEVGANGSTCYNWDDPLPDMLLSLNSLMFRTGLWAGTSMTPSELKGRLTPGATVNVTVDGNLIGPHNVFQTNFSFFFAATLLEALCIVVVLPTYWGFWRLGRSHSLSPLEIAKAFDSPLLQDCDPNSSGRSIAQSSLGDTRIRYGAARTVRRGSVASSITLRSPIDTEKICFAEVDTCFR